MKRVCVIATAFLCTSSLAHEGMWLPSQLPDIASEMKAAGLELESATLSRLTEYPLGAVVSLGNCTASFVSPRGLVVTNYHCAYGSIQYNSTPERNLIRDGFLAQSLKEELPAAPGSRVLVTVEVRDVTDEVVDARTARLRGAARTEAIDANRKSLIEACERAAGYRCSVPSFYGGLQFQLIKQLELRDVRLVYAPPEGVGKFGGDTDNWMWPRHTGDFAFYRAYVGRNGQPADYDLANVPYEPAHHLKVARKGVADGDFVMVAGYPWRTNRHRLTEEIEFAFHWEFPASLRAVSEQLDIISHEVAGREEAQIAYAATVLGLKNFHKKTEGLLRSFERTDLAGSKRREMQGLKAWIAADRGRTRQFSADIEAVEAVIAEKNSIAREEFLQRYATPRLLDVARELYKLALERAKPDDRTRKPGYQQRDWRRWRQMMEAVDKRYDARVDKALVLHFLKQYLAQPAKGSSPFLKALGISRDMDDAALAARLDALYSASSLQDRRTRLRWLELSPRDLEQSSDSFIAAAIALHADDVAREKRRDRLNGDLQRLYSTYMKALIAYKASKGEAVYPDANGTLRVTFGNVAGKSPGDTDGTAWAPFTTLRGIQAKHTGTGEFNAPGRQLAAIQSRQFGPYREPSLDSVPVNFLSTLDITGGNSGSPVLDSRGELVGVAFDGTLDAVDSDWHFDSAATRTIAVDLRYMLWQMREVDDARALLTELGVE